MNVSEEQLTRWANPPSETEESKCQATVSRITRAIRARWGGEVTVTLQGSYRNRTNVKQDSDVDIAVCNNNYYFPDLGGLSEEERRLYRATHPDSTYTFAQFKNDIQNTLETEFDYGEVVPKDKCLKILKNDQRVDADVVPCFGFKRFINHNNYDAEGIAFKSDSGVLITSYPEHHYENGVNKNDRTDRRYKSIVRIMKNVRNELVDMRSINEKEMSSFFLECLIWNVSPDSLFSGRSYADATRNIIITIWNEMADSERIGGYMEVNNLKSLFGAPDRTSQQARSFMNYAWNFMGY